MRDGAVVLSLRRVAGTIARTSPLRWVLPNKVTRMEVISSAISGLGAQRYLEIGVADGSTFCAVDAPEKIGVDPIPPEPAVRSELSKPGVDYFAEPSDLFFERSAPERLTEGVDVVFVDGLHTFDQSYRDCQNALKYLRRGGLIILHDCLPTSAAEASGADSFEEALAENEEQEREYLWTGEVWKTIVQFRVCHPEVTSMVLNCDHGVGLLFVEGSPSPLTLTPKDIRNLTFEDLARNPRGLLGLTSPAALFRVLRRLRMNSVAR